MQKIILQPIQSPEYLMWPSLYLSILYLSAMGIAKTYWNNLSTWGTWIYLWDKHGHLIMDSSWYPGFLWDSLQWTFSVFLSTSLIYPRYSSPTQYLFLWLYLTFPTCIAFLIIFTLPSHFFRLISNTNSFMMTFFLNIYTTTTHSLPNKMFLSFYLLIPLSLHPILCVTVVSVSFLLQPLNWKS